MKFYSSVLDEDCQILAEFGTKYSDAVAVMGWSNMEQPGWCCNPNASGVHCLVEKVAQIDLWNRNIYGSVPLSLGRLAHLVSLDLGDNHLKGNLSPYTLWRGLRRCGWTIMH